MLEYLKEHAQTPLAKLALNDVDLLVFSQLAYINFPAPAPEGRAPLCLSLARAMAGGAGLRPLGAADTKADMEYAPAAGNGGAAEDARFGFQRKHDDELMARVSGAARYAGLRVLAARSDYDPDMEKQFAMLALELPGGGIVLAFRGTDNTLAGWKEDCNLAFDMPVPAQTEALGALAALADNTKGDIILCGHSKGGNLALYAAVFAPEDIQARVSDAVSFDGPGLPEDAINTEAYARARHKLRAIMPRASIVGLFFERPDNVRFIQSRAVSLLQHYPYFWKTQGADFITAPDQSASARLLGKSMQMFLSKLTREDKRAFAQAVYRILRASNAETIPDLLKGYLTNTPAILKAILKEDKKTYLLYARVCLAFWRSVLSALTDK